MASLSNSQLENIATSFELSRWQALLLQVTFVAAGIGCALPGALLPALLSSWQWTDTRAGAMLLIITGTSAASPLLIRRAPHVAVILGQFLAAIGTAMWAHHFLSPLVAAALFGSGLGLSMTGVSLIFARKSGSDSHVLARLNVLWAVGACCCPPLMTHALRTNSPRGILLCMAVGFLLLGILNIGLARQKSFTHKPIPASLRGISIALLFTTALTTGIEASCGGWLATYAQRSHHKLESTVLAPSMFWAGLLVSRLIVSATWKGRAVSIPARALAALATIAIAAVLTITADPILLVSTFLLGCGLGPLYPELLARVLRIKENTGIFLLAGIAPALMTYSTGFLSTTFSSLRVGLCVPLIGCAIMFIGLLQQSASNQQPARS